MEFLNNRDNSANNLLLFGTLSVDVELSVQNCPVDPPCPISDETWENWFAAWIEYLKVQQAQQFASFPLACGYELSLRLTDDREIQSLNAQYRQIDQPTDVLAFAALEVETPISTERGEYPLYLGDIVISVETANQQAQQQQHSLQCELAWLAAHGLLHLLGWDHPDDETLEQMLNQQQNLLQLVGINAPSLQLN